MRNNPNHRRRAATGLGLMSVGAALVVTGLASPASAHGKQEPEPAPNGSNCIELGNQFELNTGWSETVISDLPDEAEYTNTYDLGNGQSVEVTVENRKYIEWTSTIGIDAVYVQGEDDEKGGYFYIYAESPSEDDEETSDYHLGTPPWGDENKNKIESISFCYDDKTPPSTTTPPSTAPPTTETPTTTPPSTEAPTTTVPEETTTTEAPQQTTVAPTTAPSTTVPDTEGNLPKTGSNTGLLVAVGVGLLALGGVLLATKRQLWSRISGGTA
jgi:LPXTG-motif cell wall-anchored protein